MAPLDPPDNPVGRLVRLARQRHQRDLDSARCRGLSFDEDAAAQAVQFFGLLRHSKGEWAGRPFALSPWQEHDVIRPLFGWKRADGTRRYRVAYLEVARKNGKSTMAAAIGNKLFLNDGEPGAEVYTAATKRDQARITHEESKAQVRGLIRDDPRLRRHIIVSRDNLAIPSQRCKYEPLGADADTMDGLNVHAAIVDELHMHKRPDVWNVLETATAARRQPLLFGITTAGFDRTSICWHLHDYAAKVLDGTIEDDSFFAYVCTLDEGDDWTDRRLWAKANPNLHVTVKEDDLLRKFHKARESPAFENDFKRLHLNLWTEQSVRWLAMDRWDACAGKVDLDALAGAECYGGLDLAPKRDLSALVLVFPVGDCWQVVPYFWMPEENLRERERRDRLPYTTWVRQGLITATPGNVTDYAMIQERIIEEIARRFNVKQVAFDPYGATEMVTKLMEHSIEMVEFRQTIQHFNEPTQKLEALITGRKIAHGGHPVLRAHAQAVTVKTDLNENIRPVKDRTTGRIDGIVALIMALGRCVARDQFRSIYETRGLLRLEGPEPY